jgi:hypothetical protein
VRGRFHLIPLFGAEPVAEHDGELGHGGGPFALSIFPVLGDVAQDQIQQLDRRLVGREVQRRRQRLAVLRNDEPGVVGQPDPAYILRVGAFCQTRRWTLTVRAGQLSARISEAADFAGTFSYGWGTWIRTKDARVRAGSFTAKLSPTCAGAPDNTPASPPQLSRRKPDRGEARCPSRSAPCRKARPAYSTADRRTGHHDRAGAG